MGYRFISPAVHGVFDYLAAIVLVLGPWVLDFNGAAAYISILFGVALFVYSLLTNYPDGLSKMIPFKVHLIIDVIAGIVLVVAPYVFSYSSAVAHWFHVIAGIVVILLVICTDPRIDTMSASTPMGTPMSGPSAM